MAYISTFHHANGGWIMRILIKDVKIYNGCEQGFYGGMMIADGKIERVLKAAELAAVNTENVQVISGEGKNNIIFSIIDRGFSSGALFLAGWLRSCESACRQCAFSRRSQ